jgi:GntR family transcriptional regulator/MocR family aminotransferase
LLHRQVADYLATAHGITCTADQVVIVSGIRQALMVAARLLLDP